MLDLLVVWGITLLVAIIVGRVLFVAADPGRHARLSKQAKTAQAPLAQQRLQIRQVQPEQRETAPRQQQQLREIEEQENRISSESSSEEERDEGTDEVTASLSEGENRAAQEWRRAPQRQELLAQHLTAGIQRPPPPPKSVVDEQYKFRDRSKELFELLRSNMNSDIETAPTDLITDIQNLFCTDLPTKFSSSRAAQCTAMSLCCTVVVQEDVSNLGNLLVAFIHTGPQFVAKRGGKVSRPQASLSTSHR
eukprot:Protomagalhaensia_wolfi_Nauph_80__5929@NODE_782_length_2004_cov_136_603562_g589_i0_p2_GENE_NODE_782_length_2004_cov_136_603562_g589_i0NODE_782_length_2004_cov_136_603562_g589_i0_p2_ORF_typecomplete_len250_score41_32HemX/PF04375_14/0_021CortBP2/PF09727_9/0_11DUF812/PF05667_11/0_13Borrelia_P83/PF05262_11/0_11DUF4834/PF16118_5/0_15Pap_E4/PF02711_14/36Pap_E4/PF02711_14/1_5e02_NODE_782_length_2004_cov_136_603562_g589_i051800